jgi:DNA-binding MarR family transcriptional regulator
LIWFGASTAPLLSESARRTIAYLSRGRSLGLSRLLREIEPAGSEVRLLRARLSLDSGYFSRQLRRLEADRLVTTDPDDGDGRVRKVRLTRKGLAERAVLDSSSNELAASILTPLTEPQRDRLVTAMADVERLILASQVRVEIIDPRDIDARYCLRSYFEELGHRFDPEGLNGVLVGIVDLFWVNYRCRCVGLLTLGELCRLNLGDHVDFDAYAKWQLCDTGGAARMDAPLAEDLDKQLRRPIRNPVRFRELRRAVDHDKELYDSSNSAKIADGGFKHGQQFNCHMACGELALIQADLIAHFPTEELTVYLAKAAGEINLIAGTSERCECRHISIDDWRHDVG